MAERLGRVLELKRLRDEQVAAAGTGADAGAVDGQQVNSRPAPEEVAPAGGVPGVEAVGANLAAEDTGVQEVELEGNQVCPRFQHCRDIQAHGRCWCEAREDGHITPGRR